MEVCREEMGIQKVSESRAGWKLRVKDRLLDWFLALRDAGARCGMVDSEWRVADRASG